MAPSLKKGDSCVACPGGPWARMNVLRCNADGTYKLLPEGGDFLDEWEGVTRDEISFEDDALWPSLFDSIRDGKPGIGVREARVAVERAGFRVDDAQIAEVWAARQKELFGREDAAGVLLDRDEAYRFFLSVGVSALSITGAKAADPNRDLYKLYWNGVRMGGRRPEDVGRPIGLVEALAANALDGAAEDVDAVTALARFEVSERLALPATLKALWSKKGALDVLRNGHCNNPEPQPPAEWKLVRRTDERWEAPFAVRVMLPHQGSHAWWVLFADGADDGEVWISFEEDGGPVRRVARSVSFFFWDLRETSRMWEQRDGVDASS